MADNSRGMNFWLVKGNKQYPTRSDARYGDLREILEDGEDVPTWGTKRRIPAEFSKGDGVFFWSSSPDCFVIGLGVVVDPNVGYDGTYNRFSLKYLVGPLDKTASIDELRESVPRRADGEMATFLMAAAAQTIYSMTHEQAICLANTIARSNLNRERAGETLQQWELLER